MRGVQDGAAVQNGGRHGSSAGPVGESVRVLALSATGDGGQTEQRDDDDEGDREQTPVRARSPPVHPRAGGVVCAPWLLLDRPGGAVRDGDPWEGDAADAVVALADEDDTEAVEGGAHVADRPRAELVVARRA